MATVFEQSRAIVKHRLTAPLDARLGFRLGCAEGARVLGVAAPAK